MEEFAIETLQELVEMVRVASPMLWQIARQQVWANLVETVLWLVFALFALLASVRWYRWLDTKIEKGTWDTGDDYEVGKIVAALIVIASTIATTGLLGGIVKALVNPNYYAIKVIAGLLK